MATKSIEHVFGKGYPNYQNFENWNDDDFEKYREWCLFIISDDGLVYRECWHLHCHPEKCTMQTRVIEQCKALIETGVFPKEICKMIAIEIPSQDKIN